MKHRKKLIWFWILVLVAECLFILSFLARHQQELRLQTKLLFYDDDLRSRLEEVKPAANLVLRDIHRTNSGYEAEYIGRTNRCTGLASARVELDSNLNLIRGHLGPTYVAECYPVYNSIQYEEIWSSFVDNSFVNITYIAKLGRTSEPIPIKGSRMVVKIDNQTYDFPYPDNLSIRYEVKGDEWEDGFINRGDVVWMHVPIVITNASMVESYLVSEISNQTVVKLQVPERPDIDFHARVYFYP